MMNLITKSKKVYLKNYDLIVGQLHTKIKTNYVTFCKLYSEYTYYTITYLVTSLT